MNQPHPWKSNLLLLLTACIWGFAFVAQREGMAHIGPFTFNAVRFALGALSLVPLIAVLDKRSGRSARENAAATKRAGLYGIGSGVVLFGGASLQQIGLVDTTAGKAAFVTGLYIVLVPFLGLFMRQRLNWNSSVGAALAVVGLYLLCVTDGFTLNKGDVYELLGALCWAVHILVIDRLTRRADGLKLSLFQTLVCSLLSFVVALATEKIEFAALKAALIPLLYGGICSVGIAYTLQIVGQKGARPAQAAIILSMETVFAAIGGYVLLDEQLGTRGVLGCAAMLAGMLLPQLAPLRVRPAAEARRRRN